MIYNILLDSREYNFLTLQASLFSLSLSFSLRCQYFNSWSRPALASRWRRLQYSFKRVTKTFSIAFTHRDRFGHFNSPDLCFRECEREDVLGVTGN